MSHYVSGGLRRPQAQLSQLPAVQTFDPYGAGSGSRYEPSKRIPRQFIEPRGDVDEEMGRMEERIRDWTPADRKRNAKLKSQLKRGGAPKPKKPRKKRPPKGRVAKCKVITVRGKRRRLCWDKHGTLVKNEAPGKRKSRRRK